MERRRGHCQRNSCQDSSATVLPKNVWETTTVSLDNLSVQAHADFGTSTAPYYCSTSYYRLALETAQLVAAHIWKHFTYDSRKYPAKVNEGHFRLTFPIFDMSTTVRADVLVLLVPERKAAQNTKLKLL